MCRTCEHHILKTDKTILLQLGTGTSGLQSN